MTEEFKKELQIIVKRERNGWNNDQTVHKLDNIAIREIFATKHEVNPLRNEKGMVIPGTGRIISSEEKKMILDYIVDNDFPLTKKIYNFILKGYVGGEIEIETKGKGRKM